MFFSGFVTGLLTSNMLLTPSSEQPRSYLTDATLNDLADRLGLNPSQMEEIRVILDDVIMEEAELLSELEWNQSEARRRISNHLTTEQNEIFNEIIAARLEAR